MNKNELVEAIAQRVELPKNKVRAVVDAFCDLVIEVTRKGDRVTLVGFGTFYPAERKERKGRNPRTGEEMVIPAHTVVRFKPGKGLRF